MLTGDSARIEAVEHGGLVLRQFGRRRPRMGWMFELLQLYAHAFKDICFLFADRSRVRLAKDRGYPRHQAKHGLSSTISTTVSAPPLKTIRVLQWWQEGTTLRALSDGEN